MNSDSNDASDPRDAQDARDGAADPLWDRWDEVDTILAAALERPAAEREAFLTEACEGDPELLRLVSRLSALDDSLESPRVGVRLLDAALDTGGGAHSGRLEDLIGTTLGAYRLTRLIGTGGMGAVYAAERADDAFERTVAVKVLRHAVNTADVATRFATERRILASLRHPGIAQLLDGGVTQDGRPYLVMEYIEGKPVDVWVDDRHAGIEARIRLVVDVAEAVEYAHRHMVVHRDLKPGNILVHDDGSVKLLDFGVAKLLEAPGEGAPVTETRSRFLTPEYAAPEQLLGEPASAQTDVYALAALLYELLTGSRPYARDRQDSSGEGVLEQVIRGGEPTAPSAVSPPDDAWTARLRSWPGSPTAESMRRRLSGDLDAILLRALRARPSERYPSVAAFRDDLLRHLDGCAVSVRSDAWAYRTKRFLWRHRIAAGVLTGVFLLVSGSAAGLALQRSTLIQERDRADAASAQAALEAETARQTTAFLVDLFEANDPVERFGDTLTARALLDRGVQQVQSTLADQPAVRAELLSALGRSHVNLGSQEEGIGLLELGVALRRDSVPDQVGLGEALVELGYSRNRAFQHEQSLSAAERAVDVARAQGDSATWGRGLVLSGLAHGRLDRLDVAEERLRQGLDLLPDRLLTQEERWAATRTLASIVRRRGDLEEADSLYAGVVAAMRATSGVSVRNFSNVLNDLAVNRRMMERFSEAVVLYREALDSLGTFLGPAHPEVLNVRLNLVTALDLSGRMEESVIVVEENVRVAREAWPDGHWRLARELLHLGGQLIRSDRPEEALAPLSEAVDMAMVQMGPRHTWTNVYRAWLAMAAQLTGRDAAADQLMGWAMEGFTTYEGLSEDRIVQSMIRALADVMRDKGLGERAAELEAVLDN